MLIRAYRMRGHLPPSSIRSSSSRRRPQPELDPRSYGFTEADLDRPIFIDKVLGLEHATIREIVAILQPHLLPDARRRVHAHLRSRSRRPGSRSASKARTRRSPSRREGKRAILNKLIEAEGFEKFLDVKYTGTKRFGLDGGESTDPGARADHQARRPARRAGDRARHGASRPAQRARQVMGKPHRVHLPRIQGRLGDARRGRGLGRREVSPRRVVGPRVRRQQGASVAHRQSVASRNRRSGGARQGARQAGSARRDAGRPHHGAAAADPWRCRVRRPGRGRGMLRAVGTARATAPAARCISSSTTRSASPPIRAIRAPRPIRPTSPR